MIVWKNMGATTQNTLHLILELRQTIWEPHCSEISSQAPSQDGFINSDFSWILTVCWVSYWKHFVYYLICPFHNLSYRWRILRLRGFNLPKVTEVVSGGTGNHTKLLQSPILNLILHYLFSYVFLLECTLILNFQTTLKCVIRTSPQNSLSDFKEWCWI